MKKVTVRSQKKAAAPEVMQPVAKPADKKVFSGKDVVSICASKIVEINIPGWDGCIRGRVPSPKKILELRTKAPTNEAFQEQLFRACLIDFTDEDFEALADSNGLRYYELMTAVIENTDLFSKALSQDNVKN